jgi:hypothetical protein
MEYADNMNIRGRTKIEFLRYTTAGNGQHTSKAKHQNRKNKTQWYRTGQQKKKVKF